MVRADLHMHGAIGFQPYWLKKQGYSGNLLKLITDECLVRKIDICAVTSEAEEIPKGSVHDRLGYLINESSSLPSHYKVDRLGENVLVVEINGNLIHLVNGQTVIVKEDGKRLDHLVIGSNQVPNFRNLRDTLQYGKDNGLIQVAEHPFVKTHFGIGSKLEDYVDDYDAIEGHNSQLILPIGQYSNVANEEAQEFAHEHNKPWIAVSDAHRVEDIGISYIDLKDEISSVSEDKFLEDLRKVIIDGNFIPVGNFISYLGLVDWVSKFKIGTWLKRDQ